MLSRQQKRIAKEIESVFERLHEGKSAYSKGEFYRAITEYKRCIFHHPQGDYDVNFANYRIGLCYKQGGEWGLAQNYLKKVLEAKADKELNHKACIALARVYLNEGKHSLARLELNESLQMGLSLKFISEAHYWKGLTYLYECKWEKALSEFNQVTDDKFAFSVDSLESELKKAMSLPCKSEKFSLWMSTLIPGSGQIYSRSPWRGTISFLLNGSLAYLTYRLADSGDYVGAGVVFWSGFLRFYPGNRSGALSAAKLWNENLNIESINRMGPFILSNE